MCRSRSMYMLNTDGQANKSAAQTDSGSSIPEFGQAQGALMDPRITSEFWNQKLSVLEKQKEGDMIYQGFVTDQLVPVTCTVARLLHWWQQPPQQPS